MHIIGQYLKSFELVIALSFIKLMRRLRSMLYHLTIDKFILLIMIKSKQQIIKTNAEKHSRTISNSLQNTNESRDFITKQFINNLKLQISQKIKPSKSILEALKHSNTINQTYKANIKQLTSKIESLTEQNKQLKAKIIKFEQTLKKNNNKNSIITTSQQIKQRTASELHDMQNNQLEQTHHLEIQILKEKLQHLQEYKVVKQVRFQQIIERQAQYVGEINILKYKNQNLQSSIQHLQSSIYPKAQQNEQKQKPDRKKSEQSQKFKEYINHEECKQDISIEQYRIRQPQNLAIPTLKNVLMESYTNNIQIEEAFNLQNIVQNSKKIQNKSFLEIDYILGEDLSSEKIVSNIIIPSENDLMPNNLNNSIIAININQPEQSNFTQ